MYSFSIVVIENLYIQTSLMVALNLFRGKEEGGGIYKSEVDIKFNVYGQDPVKSPRLAVKPPVFDG